MATFYNVPLIAQHSSDTCWHAGAIMIWQYWQGQTARQGPMNTLAPAYAANRPIGERAWARLARKVGMTAIPPTNAILSSNDIETLLKNHGPLWCGGLWFGVGHVVVLTGVDNANVYLNDPDGGVKKQGTIAWFNQKFWNDAMMYKDPAAY